MWSSSWEQIIRNVFLESLIQFDLRVTNLVKIFLWKNGFIAAFRFPALGFHLFDFNVIKNSVSYPIFHDQRALNTFSDLETSTAALHQEFDKNSMNDVMAYDRNTKNKSSTTYPISKFSFSRVSAGRAPIQMKYSHEWNTISAGCL